ncbi:MAG: amine dehydrogenase [Deltaproteobacteria bacterium]|nr:amine dehydrogenase [Deltaproteobacteria bacterium]MBW2389964.1 amine dehydrogenase [Deltaproteobacteria bacterium]MBW2723004.1 amine dehydrogenase [Deltaproteobacteria bacterium]
MTYHGEQRRRLRAEPFSVFLLSFLLLFLSVTNSNADVPIESIGRVEVLDRPFDPHWLWSADASGARIALVDLDEGTLLGQINTGWGMPDIVFSRTRPEIYVPETYFSRGTRGTRTDVASIYDARSLAPISEVLLPSKRAINPLAIGNSALSDDDRFLAVFNMTPATSLSIVDVETRSLVGEVATPGCSLVYAIGQRRFATLCADGGLLIIGLDEAGAVTQRIRSEPFFDPQADPVTEKAVRWGDRWIFVSFEGVAHPVDFSATEPRFEQSWSLLSDDDRDESWKIGGAQHLALHQASGRLYSLVHEGGADTHKQAGSEVWVYDLESRERVQRIELRSPSFTFMGYPIPLGSDRLNAFLLDHVVPSIGIDQITVTQDDEPLLLTGAIYTGALCVYDARSGELLRRLFTGNMTTQGLFAQPRRER